MKERCETCRYWQREQEVLTITERRVVVAGYCGGIGATWDWRLGSSWPAEGENALLIDANAILLTTADFGCTEWRSRTPRRGGLLR